MPLRFGQDWLRPSDLMGAANLLIVAWDDDRRLTFTVRRALLVRHLPATSQAGLSAMLERWKQVIQRACVSAASRVEAYKSANIVEVAAEDFLHGTGQDREE